MIPKRRRFFFSSQHVHAIDWLRLKGLYAVSIRTIYSEDVVDALQENKKIYASLKLAGKIHCMEITYNKLFINQQSIHIFRERSSKRTLRFNCPICDRMIYSLIYLFYNPKDGLFKCAYCMGLSKASVTTTLGKVQSSLQRVLQKERF